jgi:hypothetical protein
VPVTREERSPWAVVVDPAWRKVSAQTPLYVSVVLSPKVALTDPPP